MLENKLLIENIRFDENGLVPAVAQDVRTGAVLMLAYMNREALEQSLSTGFATYYSRSRQRLWKKGETSGHVQRLRGVRYDCDADALLLLVEQTGNACHTGAYSCFAHPMMEEAESRRGASVLYALSDIIDDRRAHPQPGSYTNYLFDKGVDKICKKVGEESAEVIIAAKNGSKEELRSEAGDLLYHLLVLLRQQEVSIDEVFAELERRHAAKSEPGARE